MERISGSHFRVSVAQWAWVRWISIAAKKIQYKQTCAHKFTDEKWETRASELQTDDLTMWVDISRVGSNLELLHPRSY
jgi:hypothetical protein